MKKSLATREFLRWFLVTALWVCAGLGMSVALTTMPEQDTARAATTVLGDGLTPSDLNVITINNRGYHKDRKGPVKFPHRQHAKEYAISCWDCHHVYEKGKNVYSPWGTTERCKECHNPLEKQGKVIRLQTAYHSSCKGCHKKRDIYKGEPRAYKKCTKCHEKRRK